MSNTKEAWEHIAGELPPGADEGDEGSCWFAGLQYESASDCWAVYERITNTARRDYAELIAPQRVREAAGANVSDPFDVEFVFDDQGTARVWVVCPVDARIQFGYGEGPDICTAAWAAICTLEGKSE